MVSEKTILPPLNGPAGIDRAVYDTDILCLVREHDVMLVV